MRFLTFRQSKTECYFFIKIFIVFAKCTIKMLFVLNFLCISSLLAMGWTGLGDSTCCRKSHPDTVLEGRDTSLLVLAASCWPNVGLTWNPAPLQSAKVICPGWQTRNQCGCTSLHDSLPPGDSGGHMAFKLGQNLPQPQVPLRESLNLLGIHNLPRTH